MHVNKCKTSTADYAQPTVLDDGNAVEIPLVGLGDDGLDCLRDSLGISEATFKTSSVGETLEGDGYSMVVTPGGKFMVVVERM